MDSDMTIAVLGLLLLLAGFGLVFMARALEEARSHQEYLRGQVSKFRSMALARGDDEDRLGLVKPPGTPTGSGWDLDALPGRPGRVQTNGNGAISPKRPSAHRDPSRA